MDAIARKSKPVRSRSKVSNGNALFSGSGRTNPVDLRTVVGRRFSDLVESISLDLGGPEVLSESQRQLVRRIALIAVQLETQEAKALMGEKFDLAEFAIASNHMKRLMETLGVKRVAKNVNAVGSIVGQIKASGK